MHNCCCCRGGWPGTSWFTNSATPCTRTIHPDSGNWCGNGNRKRIACVRNSGMPGASFPVGCNIAERKSADCLTDFVFRRSDIRVSWRRPTRCFPGHGGRHERVHRLAIERTPRSRDPMKQHRWNRPMASQRTPYLRCAGNRRANRVFRETTVVRPPIDVRRLQVDEVLYDSKENPLFRNRDKQASTTTSS